MEKSRTAVQKVEKMKEMGIFDKWVTNTDKRYNEFANTNPVKQELNGVQRRNRLLATHQYLSDMIECSFIFAGTPEGSGFWGIIVDSLRREI